MESDIKYAEDVKIWIHLFLMPMKQYIKPVAMRSTPATEKAGVISGVNGSSSMGKMVPLSVLLRLVMFG